MLLHGTIWDHSLNMYHILYGWLVISVGVQIFVDFVRSAKITRF